MNTNKDQYIPEHASTPTHLDHELARVRRNTLEMFKLVLSQLSKAEEALLFGDKNLAREVRANEKRVDAMELSITIDCENILALFTPVAVDLRFVLAVLKISYNLERIGDYAKSIAAVTEHLPGPVDPSLIDKTGLRIMFKDSSTMLHDVCRAYELDNNKLAVSVFGKDEAMDKINKGANMAFTSYINEGKDDVSTLLYLLNVVKRLERVGDQAKNIAEEIIFYLEAKVIKHDKEAKKGFSKGDVGKE
jgi:phosphate transport system protein